MTIEKYKQMEKMLYDYKYTKGYIELRKADLQALEYEGVKAVQYSTPSVQTSGISDPVAMEFERLEKQRDFLQRTIREKERAIEKIDFAVKLLDDIEQKIIEMKYFKGSRNQSIADNLGYSKKQIERIKKKAIHRLISVIWIN